MTCWQAMHALELIGYRFELRPDGRVRALLQGSKPPEADALLSIVRQDPDSASAFVRERHTGSVVTEDGSIYSLLDALAIGQAVRKGEARLLGMVIFHRQEMTVTVRWEPISGELSHYRERLINALKAHLKAMEDSEYWNLSAEEYAQFCAKYERYCTILEGKL